MPYTRIELTCETCGKTFEHRHNCMKSRDIESYNAWAIKNVTECPECSKQSRCEAKAAKMREEKVIIRISYRDYKNGCELDTVPNSYDPETKTIEVAIERERAMDIALLAKSDDELAKMAVEKGVATKATAEEYIKSTREENDKFYADVIGKNWKMLIEKYADQLPEIEEEEAEEEAEEETEEEKEEEKEAVEKAAEEVTEKVVEILHKERGVTLPCDWDNLTNAETMYSIMHGIGLRVSGLTIFRDEIMIKIEDYGNRYWSYDKYKNYIREFIAKKQREE